MVENWRVNHRLIQGLTVGLVAALITLTLWIFNWLNVWEAKTFDWRAGLLAKPGIATDDIRLILLDQNSLDWAFKENGLTWPWPRELYSAIVNFCQRSGVKALAFDVLYTEPSKYGVSDDFAFSEAVGYFGRFAGAVFLGQKSGNAIQWPKEIPGSKFKIKGLPEWLAQAQTENTIFTHATFPITELAQNAAALCNIHLEPDTDGIYRRVNLFGIFDNNILPSLGIGTYLAINPHETATIKPGRITIGNRVIPIDKKGNAILRFRGPSHTYKAYSAAAVLQSEIRILNGEAPTIRDKDTFGDKYVLFGFTAPGLYDLRSAPVSGVYSGVEIHATMLDNFLSGDFLQESPSWLVITLVIFLSLSCAVLASVFSGLWRTSILSGIFLVIPIILSLGAYGYGIWLPMVTLELAIVLSIVLALGVNYATEGRQKRFIKSAFKQYLSPAVIEQLLQNPQRLKLGGERKTLSIFFSDLQGFTSISEGLDPELLTNLLNDYLSAMTEIIHAEGGTVDKYEGDAIIAFWNAPLEVPDHAIRITQAALRCQAKLREMQPSIRERIGKDIYMRIGINTGIAVVGNMGSCTRFDYTMMGDEVNLAARLEGSNKQFGTYTMMSQSTRQLIGDIFCVRELARVAVVGRRKPITVFEPMFEYEYVSKQKILEEFSKGLDLFYKGLFRQARDIFKSIEDRDPPADAYLKKCNELITTMPDNWDGVWVMTSK